ncbi:MAG: hypothetical protein ACLP00_15285 [Terracidiphilus sp.]
MIRQAISCDICGRDKQQTNHWFVAYEHGTELRIGGWNSQARLRISAKHLCGQTCLHKLVDDYMARTLAMRTVAAADEPETAEQKVLTAPAARTDASLTSAAAHPPPIQIAPQIVPAYSDEGESSARILASTTFSTRAEPKAVPTPPNYNSRAWRVEAWKREQAREQRTARNSPGPRRRSIA